MTTKAGYVTIIGRPNVGKSTLMNKILKERLSIITNKPQTTRKKVLGILSEDNYQIIFQDTPGILDPNYLLQEKMMDHVAIAAKDADVLLVIVDMQVDPDGIKTFEDEQVSKFIEKTNAKKILLLNKIDKSEPELVEKLALSVKEKGIFDRIIGLSALMDYNVDQVKESIIEFLPEGSKLYPDDQLTDENERFFVSEIIREKILEYYRDEIPYSVEVVIEEFKERKKSKDYINASIIVEKESQKPIIIGNKGTAIKELGQIARRAIDEFLQRGVFLELRVKVKPNWRSDSKQMKTFGYQLDKDDE